MSDAEVDVLLARQIRDTLEHGGVRTDHLDDATLLGLAAEAGRHSDPEVAGFDLVRNVLRVMTTKGGAVSEDPKPTTRDLVVMGVAFVVLTLVLAVLLGPPLARIDREQQRCAPNVLDC